MADDASPQVRVVAAEAVAELGDIGDALAVLTSLADGEQPWQVKLQALNALTALGEATRPALPTFERAAASPQEYLRNAGRYMSAVLKGEYTPAYPVFPMPGRA
jgi:HEAT repeat protein